MSETFCIGEFTLSKVKPARTPEQVLKNAKKLADAGVNWSWEDKTTPEGLTQTIFRLGERIYAQVSTKVESIEFTVVDSSGELGCDELCSIMTKLFETDLASLHCRVLKSTPRIPSLPGRSTEGKTIDWKGMAVFITAITALGTFLWREVIADLRKGAKKRRKKRKKKEENGDYWSD